MNGRFPVVNLGRRPRMGTEGNAPLPMPNGALYRHPNPDGTRKRCGNCVMFIESEDRCFIHPPDLEVAGDMWCGYHIFGKPMAGSTLREGMQAVTPDISGLRRVGAGAACAGCQFYKDQGTGTGLCYGVSRPDDRQPPAPVELLGNCARYEGM